MIIGGGFSSLSAACYLAHQGFSVTLYEKNKDLGGRARQLKQAGFTFDMGPTFYWMPDVFDRFFQDFGKETHQYYHLQRLNPSYKVFFSHQISISIADNLEEIKQTFESIEPGSSQKLQKFIDQAADNYHLILNDLVYQPGNHPFELVTKDTIKKLRLFFQSIRSQVRQNFSNPYLIQIMEFPVLFLGAKPSKTPAFYNFMNYADFQLGTWFPEGGMISVVEGIVQLAKELGVVIKTDQCIDQILVENGIFKGIKIQGQTIYGDILVSGADYAHTESLLSQEYRQYSSSYWDQKVLAPSALLFYVGFSKKLQKVEHHSLFFDTDFEDHIASIYDQPSWPKDPLFYASFPSITDKSLAPEGCETGIFLIPLAPDLPDSEELRKKYFEIIIHRLSQNLDQDIAPFVLFYESFGINDFKNAYHSYKGNAYGLANTLRQTHFLRPKLKSNKVKNLYFTGQLTVPGPGVPPSLISGKIVSKLISQNVYEYEI